MILSEISGILGSLNSNAKSDSSHQPISLSHLLVANKKSNRLLFQASGKKLRGREISILPTMALNPNKLPYGQMNLTGRTARLRDSFTMAKYVSGNRTVH